MKYDMWFGIRRGYFGFDEVNRHLEIQHRIKRLLCMFIKPMGGIEM